MVLGKNTKLEKTKHKKIRIAVVLVILLLITVFLKYIGILILPNFGYKIYFKLNRDSFEEIVQYAINSDDDFDVDYGMLEEDLSNITDDKVASEAKSLIKSSLFLFIREHENIPHNDTEPTITTVHFDINNLLNYDNTATSIIYSPSPVTDHPYYYENRNYWLSYEQIDDNWYLEIWHDN